MAERKAGIVSRAVIVTVLLLSLAACSGTTFVYNRLDIILPWYIDDYVNLNRAQDRQLDENLEPFLRWHRQQELPLYVEILDEVDTLLDQAVTAEDVSTIYSGVESAWLRLEEKSLDWLLAMGAGLSDAQVQEFMDYLWEKQEDYEKKYLTRTESEYREDSYDGFADSLGDYLGRLNKAQRQRLRQASAELQRSDEAWLEARAAWVEQLAVLMAREPGWQDAVRESLDRREETVSPQYQAIFDHNLAVVFEAVADVLDSRTDKQDRRLRKKLANLREDLQTLIDQGKRAQAEAG